MANNQNKWLKGLLWWGAAFHIILGLIGLFAKEAVITIAKSFYNFNLVLDPQTYWLLNPLASYMLVFGLFLAVAATDPQKYKSIIYVALFLILVRTIERLIFMIISPQDLVSTLDPMNMVLDIVLTAIYGLLLFIAARKLR